MWDANSAKVLDAPTCIPGEARGRPSLQADSDAKLTQQRQCTMTPASVGCPVQGAMRLRYTTLVSVPAAEHSDGSVHTTFLGPLCRRCMSF